MINEHRLREALQGAGLATWADALINTSLNILEPGRHGNLDKWQAIVDKLPLLLTHNIDLNEAIVRVGSDAITNPQRDEIESLLKQLSPWRKGPFSIHGVHIETEWRSDWKWDRVHPHIQPLQNRCVLDVGCGNGYHAWRMVGEGARFVLGVDPTLLFLAQFAAVAHFASDFPIHVLPLDDEALPNDMAAFDTVFSMGVLYHRRSPLDHILKLKSLLRPGGELVLETLVVEGDAKECFVPDERYAKMRNVWFIPSCGMLEIWLRRCGFKNVRTVDVTTTRTEEQHATPWMTYESLPDFLDPTDSSKTIEGHPAPIRAIVLASAP